jgi:hypothetical protein
MGNQIYKSNKIENETECFICWNKIGNKPLTKCIYCDITLHNDCAQKYKQNKTYHKCPHCQRTNTLCLVK